MAGVALTDSNYQGLSAKIATAVKKCAREIRESQMLSSALSTERLVDVLLIDLSTDPGASAIEMALEFQTEAQRAVIKLGV